MPGFAPLVSFVVRRSFDSRIPHMRASLIAVSLASVIAVSLSAQQIPRAGTGTVVLHAARVIDGTGAAPVANAVVVVTNDRIVSVGPEASVTVPAGARRVDLGNVTLLPGFIDAHVHLLGRTIDDPKAQEAATHDFPGFSAILGVEHARVTLLDGFTSVRQVGASDFEDISLRKAIDEGFVPGPRLQAAAHALGITGGHCDENA